MVDIAKTYEYSKSATEALLSTRYSDGIAKSYLDACGNEDLDPVVLGSFVQDGQSMLAWSVVILWGLTVAVPIGWFLKRKLFGKKR